MADEALAEAIAYEQQITDEAAEIRKPGDTLTREMFDYLWPLLRRPLPGGFIKSLPKLEGKPYASTGVSAVQVQIDRMDHVLGPLNWQHSTDYAEEGKIAHVVVEVLDESGEVLVSRESWGGVNRGSTTGNLFKGSYTNAAKVAFARVGPGHEVYMGAADFDPDTDEDAAKAQSDRQQRVAAERKIGKPKAAKLVEAAEAASKFDRLQLAASHVHGADVGDCSTKAKAVTAMQQLTAAEADRLYAKIAQLSGQAGEPS
jgi:hypothetical protein